MTHQGFNFKNKTWIKPCIAIGFLCANVTFISLHNEVQLRQYQKSLFL